MVSPLKARSRARQSSEKRRSVPDECMVHTNVHGAGTHALSFPPESAGLAGMLDGLVVRLRTADQTPRKIGITKVWLLPAQLTDHASRHERGMRASAAPWQRAACGWVLLVESASLASAPARAAARARLDRVPAARHSVYRHVTVLTSRDGSSSRDLLLILRSVPT